MNLLTCWEYLLGQFKSIQNDNLNVSHCHQICTPPADRGAEYLAKSDNHHTLSLFTIFSIVLLLSPALRRTLKGEDLTLPQFKQILGLIFQVSNKACHEMLEQMTRSMSKEDYSEMTNMD